MESSKEPMNLMTFNTNIDNIIIRVIEMLSEQQNNQLDNSDSEASVDLLPLQELNDSQLDCKLYLFNLELIFKITIWY